MGNPALGLAGSIVAAFMFAVQYTPVKSYEVHDGITFQWFLSSGSLFATLFITAATGDLSMNCTGEGWNPFIGGIMFGLSNYLCIPLIQLLGMGIGFSMYHFINIMTGYLLGRIGFLGIQPSGGIAGDIGCGIIGISFIILANVEGDHDRSHDTRQCSIPSNSPSLVSNPPSLSDAIVPEIDQQYREQYRRWRLGEAQGASDPKIQEMLETIEAFNPVPLRRHMPLPLFRGPTPFSALTPEIEFQPSERGNGSVASAPCLSVTAAASQNTAEVDISEGSSPRGCVKMSAGIILAIITGILTGSCATPSIKYNFDHPGTPFPATLSMNVGFWFCATVIYVAYTCYARIRRRKVPHAPIRPSLIAGALWAVGNALNTFNPTQIAYTVSYAVAIVGCLIIAGLISLLFYKEISGKKKIALFCTALLMQGVGVVMICLAGS
jgi:glucose uptake protein GlcU